jgi:hypothetical protein
VIIQVELSAGCKIPDHFVDGAKTPTAADQGEGLDAEDDPGSDTSTRVTDKSVPDARKKENPECKCNNSSGKSLGLLNTILSCFKGAY